MENLPTVLEFARKHVIEDLVAFCMNSIMDHFDEFPNHNFLTESEMLTCLANDWLHVKDEEAVFEALKAFVESKPNAPGNLVELFNCIRLDHLPREYVRSSVANQAQIRLSDTCAQRVKDCMENKLPKSDVKCRTRRKHENDRLFVTGDRKKTLLWMLNEAGNKWDLVKYLPKRGCVRSTAIDSALTE